MNNLSAILDGYNNFNIIPKRHSTTVIIKTDEPRSVTKDIICSRLTEYGHDHKWVMQSNLSSMGHAEVVEINAAA